MKRVVIFSDSLGRPRPEMDLANRTVYSDVYGKKLGVLLGTDYEVEICYMGSLDSEDGVLLSQEMVAYREPDIVVFQIGINDCAPRLFKKNSQSIILKPWFRKLTKDVILRGMSYFRAIITKFIKKEYVSVSNYRLNYKKMIENIQEYNPKCVFYAISIANGDDAYVKKSPNINNNINEYNGVLKEIFENNYIDINSLDINKLHINDMIHLTKEAHTKLAEAIYEKITKDVL